MSEDAKPQPEAADAPEDRIGERIAERRTAKGLNHDGLAKLTKLLDKQAGTGISRTTIRGYEVGLYKPGTRELRLLSQALEVTPTWLIFGGGAEGGEPPSLSAATDRLPLSEFQKFLIALPLLQSLDPAERQVVYDVLHSLARLKAGETAYRAQVISMGELGGLIGDYWADLKEHGPEEIDQEKMEALLQAVQDRLQGRIEQEFGLDLAGIAKRAMAGRTSPSPAPEPKPEGSTVANKPPSPPVSVI